MSTFINEKDFGEKKRKKPALERKDTLNEAFGDEDPIGPPDIKALDDVCDAIDICEEYEIPYDGLDELEDFQERIKLHLRKTRNREPRKIEVCRRRDTVRI